MRFHDNRGLSEQWHRYWERMGCEPLEREKLYPRGVLDSRHVTALLELSWARARGERVVSPLEDFPLELSKVCNELELGQEGSKEFKDYISLLAGLERIEVRRVTIRLLSAWERLAIAKWARIEEYMRDKARMRRVKLTLAKKRQRVYGERVKRIRERSGRRGDGQTLASVEELEALAMEEERKGDRMSYMRATRHWNQAEIRRREIAMAKRQNGEVSKVEEVKERPKEWVLERPEVELEIIRVGPNPRILVCRYKILAEELLVKLKVKSNLKFIRGMRIRMVEQEGEEWEYLGALPKHKGRW